MDPSASQRRRVRISKIAGRYLVFDIKDVAHLRRSYNICAVLTGITPQAANQNVFSGLPLELAPEEAKLLVDKAAAVVEDDAAAHVARLVSLDLAGRKAYADSLRRQRQALQAIAEEEAAEREKRSAQARVKSAGKAGKRRAKIDSAQQPALLSSTVSATLPDKEAEVESQIQEEQAPFLFVDPPKEAGEATGLQSDNASPAPQPQPGQPYSTTSLLNFTPTTTPAALLLPVRATTVEAPARSSPLQAHLNARGYFITPGLRFGGDYSVYPGDPFRYHAHFIATGYGWDEEITLLDVVGGGRLATGVKKGFLIAGAPPSEERPPDGDIDADAGTDTEGKSVRAFTLEWAAM